jgi:hypothetical protein
LIAELEKRTQGDNSGVVCVGREPTDKEVETARLRGRPVLRVHFVSPEGGKMKTRDGIGSRGRGPARIYYGYGPRESWEETKMKDDNYEKQERKAIQSESTAPKSATAFPHGANAPKSYEQQERAAIQGEHKSRGSTAFPHGANSEDDGLGSVVSAAKSGAVVGETVARGRVPGVTDEAAEYEQPGSGLPMQVSHKEMLRQCESRGNNSWTAKGDE